MGLVLDVCGENYSLEHSNQGGRSPLGAWSGLVCFEAGDKMLLGGLCVIVLALWLQELQGLHCTSS